MAKVQIPFSGLISCEMLEIQASIASEIGWHVTQQWYYQEDYMILNYAFYFFLTLGTGLWAVGIEVLSSPFAPAIRFLSPRSPLRPPPPIVLRQMTPSFKSRAQ